MMEKEHYGELTTLRKMYRKKKEEKLEKQRAITQINDEIQPKITKLRNELELQRAHLLKNKELRDESGFSNQKDWEKEIKLNLTKADEDNIQNVREKADTQIKAIEKDIENLNLDISDLHWELTIKLEYYKDSQLFTELNAEAIYVESTGK